MALQPIPYGLIDNDPVVANRITNREAWKRQSEMNADLYSTRSKIVSVGDIRFAGASTTEARVKLAIDQADLELSTIVFVGAEFFGFDATQVPGLVSGTRRMVREGGDFSTYDIIAYGATAIGSSAFDTAAINAAVASAAAAKAPAVFIPASKLPVDMTNVTPNADVRLIWEGMRAGTFDNPQSYVTEIAGVHGGALLPFPKPIAPPDAALPATGPVDIIAHWYNDFGIQYDHYPTGGAELWYDWSWNWRSSGSYDPQREPSLGFYHGDLPVVLDWQCYNLRQAGITAVSLVSTGIVTATWATPSDKHYWIYQLMNSVPNFHGMRYMLWGVYTGNLTAITAAWTDLITNVYLTFRNFYAVELDGKLYPAIYVFEAATLFTNVGGTAAAHLTFLASMADLFQAQGYGGIAVFARHPKSEASISRAALEAEGVLYFSADYSAGGSWLNIAGSSPIPVTSDATTYDAMRQSWLPLHAKPEWVVSTAYVVDDVVRRNGWLYICRVNHTSAAADTPGEGKNQSTNWFKLGPINREVVAIPTSKYAVAPHPSVGLPFFKAAGSTPDLFRQWLQAALDSVQTSGAAPIVMIYNVSEWAEGGPGLQGNRQDGFGYLEAVQKALPRLSVASGKPVVTDRIQPLFIVAATTLPSGYDRLRLDVDGNRTLTATPTIADGVDGQEITLTNVNASLTITLQDRGTLAGSGLYLTSATYVMGQWDSITLEYVASLDGWVERSRSNVL